MHILLTGGTGFIGTALTRALLQRGWQVTVLVRNPQSDAARALAAMGATLAPGDVTRRETLAAPMRGVDTVIHNAGIYRLGVSAAEARALWAVNVDGTDHMLATAAELGIGRVVYVSTIASYGPTGAATADERFERQAPPLTQYERSKTAAHAIAVRYQQQGLPLVIVCPGIVIGPGDHTSTGILMRMYVRYRLPPVAWAPSARTSQVYVDDLAEGIVRAAEYGRAGETYVLAGDTISMREIVAIWNTAPGGMKVVFWIPVRLMLLVAGGVAALARWLPVPRFLSREYLRSTAHNWVFSSEKARRELGYHYRSAHQAHRETLRIEREHAGRHGRVDRR